MALRNIIAVAGGVLGFLIAGPAGFSIGMAIGSIIGNLVDPQVIKGPRLKDLDVQISSYGDAITKAWGWVRISGNVIWATDLVEKKKEDDGKGGPTYVTYKYYGNWSSALCEAPVKVIKRVWADSKLIYGYDEQKHEYVSKYTEYFSFHYGGEDSMPSGMMEAREGVGNVPGYRGICRIDFNRFPLKNFGNRIPSISAEIFAAGGSVGCGPNPTNDMPDFFTYFSVGVLDDSQVTRSTHFAIRPEYACFDWQLREAHTFAWSNDNKLHCITNDIDTLSEKRRCESVDLSAYVNAFSGSQAERFTAPPIKITDTPWVWLAIGNYDTATGTGEGHTVMTYNTETGAIGYYNPFSYGPRGAGQFFPEWTTPLGTDTGKALCCCVTSQFGGPIMLLDRAPYALFIVDLTTGAIECIGIAEFGELLSCGIAFNEWETVDSCPTEVGSNYSEFVYAIGREFKETYHDHWSDAVWLAANAVEEQAPEKWRWFYKVRVYVDGAISYTPITSIEVTDFLAYDDIYTANLTGASFLEANLIYVPSQDAVVAIAPFGVYEDLGGGNLFGFGYGSTDCRLYRIDLASADTSFVDTGVGLRPPTNQYCAYHNVLESTAAYYRSVGAGGEDPFGANGEVYLIDCNVMEAYLWIANADATCGSHGLFAPYVGNTQFSYVDPPNCKVYLGDYNIDDYPSPTPWGQWEMVQYGPGTMIPKGVPLREIVRDINLAAGLIDGEQFNVSQLSGLVTGYYVNQEASGRQLLEPLMQVYLFDGVEIDGVLTYRHRNRVATRTIEEHHLGVIGEGDKPAPLVKETRIQELELPAEVAIKYVDKKMNYNQNAQKTRRAFETQRAEQRLTMDVPITLDNARAKSASEVILMAGWVGRTRYEISVPRTFIQLDPSDIVTLSYQGKTVDMFIENIDFGADTSLKLVGYKHEIDSYTPIGLPASDASVVDPVLEVPSPMVVEFIDGPLMLEEHDAVPGFYAVAEGEDYTVGWPGGTILDSYDNTNYVAIQTIPDATIMGYALTTLDPHTHAYIDRTNFVDVRIDSGTLVSIGVGTMLNGYNFAMIGNELIQFAEAVIVDSYAPDLVYRLSTLNRGLRGTDWAIDTHDVGDRFIYTPPSAVTPIPIKTGDIDVRKFYKGVTDGLAVDSAISFEFTAHCNHWKPLSPVCLRATRDGGNNIAMTWDRRARLNYEWRDVEIPLDEPYEAYEIDVMDGVTVKRTLTSSTPTVTYSAANQVTDFGAVQSSVTVRVYQMSSRVGRGYPCERTV